MAIRRKSVHTWVINLKKSDDYYVYKLGPKPEQAAKMIQRFVKQLLFKFKIRRILKVYNILRAEKVEEINNQVRKAVRILWSRNILSELKFELHKANLLKEIRERLGIISVRNYWRKMKFTFKIIMQKIKKFKRMIKNEERIRKSISNLLANKKNDDNQVKMDYLTVNDYSYQRNSKGSLSIDDYDSATENEEGKENKDGGESFTSEINRKIEEERQGRIAYARLAHNLPKVKEPANVLPYLYQKDILEGISPPSHYISATRASVFRMNSVSPRRHSPNQIAQTTNAIKINPLYLIKPFTSSTRRGKIGSDQSPAYMKPTTASKMCRWDAEAPNEDIEELKKNIKPREDSKVLNSTFAYNQKKIRAHTVKEKSEKLEKPMWRPSTQYHSPFFPPVEYNNPKTARSTARPSTMNVSPRAKDDIRVKSAISPIPESKIEINALSFEAALPGLSDMLNTYTKAFVVRVRPGIEKIKGFNK